MPTTLIIPRQYRMAKGWRIFVYLITPVLFVCFAILPFIFFKEGHASWWAHLLILAVCLLMIAISILAFLDAWKTKLLIDDQSLIQVKAFKTLELHYSDIKGFKTDDRYITVVPASAALPKMKISVYTEKLDELKEILAQQVPDLNQQAYDADAEKLLTNKALGNSREEREQQMQKLRELAQVLNTTGVVFTLWLILYPQPQVFAVACNVLLPLVILPVLHKYRHVMGVDEKPNNAKPNLAAAILMPPLALLLRSLWDYNLFEYGALFKWTLALTTALTLCLLYCTRNAQNKLVYKNLYYAFFFAAYSYGALCIINCINDTAPQRVYQTVVVDKWVSGGTSTSYNLKLEKWGPQSDAGDVDVSKQFYNQVQKGQTVRVHLKPGYLHIPWFFVTQ